MRQIITEILIEKERTLLSILDGFQDVREREDRLMKSFETVLCDTTNTLNSYYRDQVSTLDFLTDLIVDWAKERGLDQADATKQMLKLLEETGELAEGLAKNKAEQVKDSIGDIFVVLVVLSIQLGLSLRDCVNLAYQEIKNRKGRMVNGVFVKEEDLH